MAFDLRSKRRNLYPATTLTGAQTVTSQTETVTVGTGVRLFVYTSGTTQGSGTDSISLVAVPPDGGANIVLGTFSGTHLLSVTGGGRFVFDFRAGQTGNIAGSGVTFTAGASYGAMGIVPPAQFAVQIVIGSGGSPVATVAIDAEILP